MRRVVRTIVLTTLFLCANCSFLFGQDKDHTSVSQLDMYRHYTGTIGGRPVVLDMCYGHGSVINVVDGIYGIATFSFTDNHELATLTFALPGTADLPDKATEYPIAEGMDDADARTYSKRSRPKWVFTINGNRLTGKRYDTTAKAYDINLEENYNGSYPMDVVRHVDRRVVEVAEGLKCRTEFYTQAVTPSGNDKKVDADFIKISLSKLLSKANGTGTWPDRVKNYHRLQFSGFEADRDKIITEYTKNRNGCYYARDFKLFPEFNANGFLVFKSHLYYSIDLEIKDTTRILCLDVKEKKELHLNDILNVDTARISALIEKEIKRRFKIADNVKLTSYGSSQANSRRVTHFLKDRIPVAGTFAISSSGIIFYYGRNEIATGTSMEVFLSYQYLKGLLKPDIRKRLGIP